MSVDITQPPAQLPTEQLKSIQDGITLIKPMSRKGSGPGMIVITPNTEQHVTIMDGVPSAMRKWAEEGYAVVEIQERAITENCVSALEQARDTLAGCKECEPKEKLGLVVYEPESWNEIAPHLKSLPTLAAIVVYADVSSRLSPTTASIPLLHHLAGKPDSVLPRTAQLTQIAYPSASKYSFATPSQDSFDYSAEAVSHTRNLTLMKKHMDGPYFDLEAIWDEHTYFEFENRSVEHTMATMVDEPYVNHIPTITGGIGRKNLTDFYTHHFVFNNPDDTEMELISRTVGIDRVVDEFIFKFTHKTMVDWLIPGIPPTGKYLEIPFTAIVNIRGDRLYHEHIAWDQGTVLAQLGLLPQYLPYPYVLPDGRKPAPGKSFEYQLPVAGVETAQKVRKKDSIASNKLFEYSIREI